MYGGPQDDEGRFSSPLERGFRRPVERKLGSGATAACSHLRESVQRNRCEDRPQEGDRERSVEDVRARTGETREQRSQTSRPASIETRLGDPEAQTPCRKALSSNVVWTARSILAGEHAQSSLWETNQLSSHCSGARSGGVAC